MNEVDALDLVRTAIWTILVGSAPAIVPAMIVGIGIALLQALTQVQEITLTFIPKIVAILVMIVVAVFVFTNLVFDLFYAWLDPRIRYS